MNDSSDSTHPPDQVYLVPHRWWKDALANDGNDEKGIVYTALPSCSSGPMKLINNIFSSDIAFTLRRELLRNGESGEVGVSGRDFALVSGEMWLHALKWHTDNKAGTKDGKIFLAGEDDIADVYPLQLRLSVSRETSCLGVRIIKKDNSVELFKRACKIFGVESDMLRMWDFSGQTSLFFSNDRSKVSQDFQKQSEQELLLELQVYGLSDSLKSREGKKTDSVNPFRSSSLSVNGNDSNSILSNLSFRGHSGEVGSLGLAGLHNLGNTCFMNSALQCLAHTPKLVDYFLGDYGREINHENPLGMKGEIALAFGDLVRKLWAPGASPVTPRTFKLKLASFAPQFSGFNQHDSQELLAFLLDGLHEDLNRVKCKPYVEAKDEDDRPDEEIADEYWQYHLARNDSIIVDICQGQYKSTLVCPVCRKVSVTFDPFMYLTLPLPSTTMRTMTLTIVYADGMTRPTPYTVTVSKSGKCRDLIQALSVACALGDDEILMVAEIYNNRIIRFLEEPADSLSLIRDEDRLVAYRLKNNIEDSTLVIFMHQRAEQYLYGKSTVSWKAFGIPLAAKLSNTVTGHDIRDVYMRLLTPLRVSNEDASDATNIVERTEVEEVNDVYSEKGSALAKEMGHSAADKGDVAGDAEFEFYISNEKGLIEDSKIDIDGTVAITGPLKQSYMLVHWPEKHPELYDTRALSTLPEVYKSGFYAKRPQESASLYQCLEGFLTEEPLGPDDMWFCPGCKQHRQASKKLDLWRLPEILVIHLKRFSYSRFSKNKLESYVDFPIENLDLSSYIAYKNGGSSDRYMLYAVSNHFGSMGGGHYTAFVHHGGDRWYEFDDSHVYPISRDKIKTSAAYVLFYRRVVDE